MLVGMEWTGGKGIGVLTHSLTLSDERNSDRRTRCVWESACELGTGREPALPCPAPSRLKKANP